MNSSILFRSTALALALGAAAAAGAQNAPAAQAGPQRGAHAAQQNRAQQNGNDEFLNPKTVNSQNLAAAEQEDDTAVYRHSPSVRAIGRWLHLDQEQAARAFEYLNFLVLFGAIAFYLAKLLPKTFRGKRDTIQRQLVDARTATEQANERLTAVEQKLARLDQEIAAVRAQAEKDSEGDEQRIKAQIEEERRRIIESAEQEIAAASAAAQRELKRFAGELAVAQATRRISLSESADRALIHNFVEGLSHGGRNHEGLSVEGRSQERNGGRH